MAPPYRDSFPSDHDDLLRYSSSDHLFFSTTPQASSSSSSLSFPLFSTLDHSNSRDPRPLELNHQGGEIMDCNNNHQTIGNNGDMETGLRFTIWKQIDKSESSSCCEINNHNNNDLVKWAASSSSSKIRLVINSNHSDTAAQRIDSGRNFQDLNHTSSPSPSPSPSEQTNKRSTLTDGGGAIIRTCSDCNTTKTPLWRSGPRGPKSLCNACGIRQRKARRAMAEAAAANGAVPYGGIMPATVVLKTNKAVQRHKIMKPAAATTLKRKCKDAVAGGGGGRKKLCFEEIKIGGGLSEISSSYQRVFPQDEREAAILLMTLSYGLLHG